MTFKQVLLICLTHGMWQMYGILTTLRKGNLYPIGIAIGLATYFTYQSLFKEIK